MGVPFSFGPAAEEQKKHTVTGMLQQVAELLQVNPIRILLADPDHYIESLSQSIPESLPETIDKLIEVLKQLNATLLSSSVRKLIK
ncbi:hypothetical protein [Marinoscillum pacificum]|uniref:hypothetical protein n=1 Tax=Marinoscillum pacificum TaxID=392723 RepID=UPI002158311B|nr:hypothetical protein [Marinoscillum pacificum]